MRWAVLIAAAAIATAGCDVVLGLDNAPRRSCENPGANVDLLVLADATLDSATARGTEGILRVSDISSVLVRLQRPQYLDRITLRMSLAEYGVGCNPDPTLTITGCVPCLASSLGEVDVYLANNDWDEATVTRAERTPGVAWTDGDRVLLGTFSFGPTGLLRLEGLELAGLAPAFLGDQITLELVGTSGTNARFAAREGTECVDAVGPAATGSCEMQGSCGDAARDPGEECDGSRECTKTCEMASCGDGVVNTAAGEECDDGNFVNTQTSGLPSDPNADTCDRNCTVAACGNGLVGPGEQCDDHDMTAPPGLLCLACHIAASCGDGVVQAPYESCDDGDQFDVTNGCDSNCTFTGCGNGIVTPGEECDDGNLVNTDTCLNSCVLNPCGDGVMEVGEECDDGNRVSGDGCSFRCTCEGACTI